MGKLKTRKAKASITLNGETLRGEEVEVYDNDRMVKSRFGTFYRNSKLGTYEKFFEPTTTLSLTS